MSDRLQCSHQAGGADPAEDALSFAEADLGSDAGWPDAVAGCEYVLHVASPLPSFDDLKEGELVRCSSVEWRCEQSERSKMSATLPFIVLFRRS